MKGSFTSSLTNKHTYTLYSLRKHSRATASRCNIPMPNVSKSKLKCVYWKRGMCVSLCVCSQFILTIAGCPISWLTPSPLFLCETADARFLPARLAAVGSPEQRFPGSPRGSLRIGGCVSEASKDPQGSRSKLQRQGPLFGPLSPGPGGISQGRVGLSQPERGEPVEEMETQGIRCLQVGLTKPTRQGLIRAVIAAIKTGLHTLCYTHSRIKAHTQAC